MRRLGMEGIRRGNEIRTTYDQPADQRPLDLVNGQFEDEVINAHRPLKSGNHLDLETLPRAEPSQSGEHYEKALKADKIAA